MVGNIYIIITIIVKGTQKASKEHEPNANRITTTRGPSLTYGSKTRGGEKEKEESFIRLEPSWAICTAGNKTSSLY